MHRDFIYWGSRQYLQQKNTFQHFQGGQVSPPPLPMSVGTHSYATVFVRECLQSACLKTLHCIGRCLRSGKRRSTRSWRTRRGRSWGTRDERKRARKRRRQGREKTQSQRMTCGACFHCTYVISAFLHFIAVIWRPWASRSQHGTVIKQYNVTQFKGNCGYDYLTLGF